jgi:shikimate 5-dehydrogenase
MAAIVTRVLAAARAVLDPASAAGWRVRDGLDMLVGQAAAAFKLWTVITPDIDIANGVLKSHRSL